MARFKMIGLRTPAGQGPVSSANPTRTPITEKTPTKPLAVAPIRTPSAVPMPVSRPAPVATPTPVSNQQQRPVVNAGMNKPLAIPPTGIVGPSVSADPRRNVDSGMRDMTTPGNTIASMPNTNAPMRGPF